MVLTENLSGKKYDLEDRTFTFATDVRSFIKSIPRHLYNHGDADQLLRSSGSVGANYIEANEALSRKDFAKQIKICRKEAKESRYWLRLLKDHAQMTPIKECERLIQESHELQLIFGSIIRSMEN
jgi:four helix bundle protein